MNREILRALPKMDLLLESEEIVSIYDKFSRKEIVESLRNSLDFYRDAIINGNREDVVVKEEIIKKAKEILNNKRDSSLKSVVNGTGIVIHTNLGRSLLSDNAIKNIIKVAKTYNNLEYDIELGRRGSRYDHVESILKELTGAEGAVIVNNNAAAVMIVLNELVKDKEAIVSRGELIEIGGSFRIPEVMKMSGATLIEVGTTNRTHISDYESAINENTGALLKVHSSNFKIVGFTKEVESEELSKLGKKLNIPVIEDLGSGALIDLSKYGIDEEKTVKATVEAGVDLVTFSGDKLLGGPQAGIIVGKKKYIDRIKKNQLLRALRVDKFTLSALEGTLLYYLDEEKALKEVPTLNMISLSKDDIREKGKKLLACLEGVNNTLEINLEEENDFIGGGTLPTYKLDGYAISIKSNLISDDDLEKYLRSYKTPIITRINKGKVLIHIRTLVNDDFNIIKNALADLKDIKHQ